MITVSINDNEWSVLKIYLAKTREGTIKNLQAAHNYNREKECRCAYFNLLKKVRNMNESEFAELSNEIQSH